MAPSAPEVRSSHVAAGAGLRVLEARLLRDVLPPGPAPMADEPASLELLHARWETASKATPIGGDGREAQR